MTYIGITIGPIYKTLSGAKKTRELWGGSYLFSYLMERILEPFAVGNVKRDFIVPYIEPELFDRKTPRRVGLFHDRAIFRAEKGDYERVLKRFEEVKDELSEETPMSREFVEDYFQFHAVEVEVPEEGNIIETLTPYLDTAELFFRVGAYESNELAQMLRGDRRYLDRRAFEGKKSFPSLPRIALADLRDNYDIDDYFAKKFDDEESIYTQSTYQDQLKPYHRYVAIVHSDGDRMGKIIKTLRNQEDYTDFSKSLLNFCRNAAEAIENYGGETIFAGGDDLLFFAPVLVRKEAKSQTIFDLCEELSKIFDDAMDTMNRKLSKDSPKATLSFGVSVTYYKFPMYEALERSRSLLKQAKKGEKNAIAFEVIKHSGQRFGAQIPKKDAAFVEAFGSLARYAFGEEAENFLHSLHHKIKLHERTLHELLAKPDRGQRLKNFFDNYFNESIHKNYRKFFDTLIDFMERSYALDEDPVAALKRTYAALRFAKFVTGDKA
jgi:CRISPR-associated protein Cmr2